MAGDEEWDKSKYKNWVRGAKGLEYLQSGLQQFTGDKILYHRDQTVQKLTNTFPPGSPIQCNQCTLKNLLPEHVVLNKLCNKNTCIHHNYVNCFGSKPKGRRKCPNGICSKLYDEIVHAHRFKDPMWKNTDPSTWCSDPEGWSFAKCFQTTPNQGTSAAETDAAGLLSIILTDVDFQNEVACNLATKPSVFSIAREIRNDILHCPKMELEDPVLQNYVDAFIDVLQDPKCLIHDQGAKESLQSLLKLKTDEITISLNVEIRLIQARKDALAAFENLEEKEREVIINMEERKDEAVTEIEGATTAAIEKISDKKIQKLTQQAEARIQQLERQFNQPIETILYSREKMPSSRCTPSLSDAIENEDSDTKKTKNVIDKAWGNLIDYMNPDPILKYATEYDLFGYRQTRDIREEKYTTEKNKKILEKVRARGKSGYEKLKECLKETDQSQLVELLECIERVEDMSILLLQIHEKAIDDKPQQLTVPDEFVHDPYALDLYRKALKEGIEEDRSIRINIVGNFRQGKTCLVRRLVGESIEGVQSTNGIEVDQYKCQKESDGTFSYVRKESLDDSELSNRLVLVARATTMQHEAKYMCSNTVLEPPDGEDLELTENQESLKETVVSDINKGPIKAFETVKSDASAKNNPESHVSNRPLKEQKPTFLVETYKLFQDNLKSKNSTDRDKHGTVSFDIWDFGGQHTFYATHTIFHSRKAIYLLVFNLSLNLKQREEDESEDMCLLPRNRDMAYYIRFWLNSIHSFVSNGNGTEPPVILVGTHKDKLHGDEVGKRRQADKYFCDVRDLFEDTQVINHIRPEDFAVDNTDIDDESISQLRETIIHLGEDILKTVTIPAKWMQLERVLIKNRTKKIISLDKVIEMDAENEFPIADIEQVKLFLKYHHNKGALCYFDEEPISNDVVLDPQYLIDAFKCIITSGVFCKKDIEMRTFWKKLLNEAKLEHTLIDKVWGRDKDKAFSEHKRTLIAFLKKHHVLSEAMRYDPDKQSSKGLGWYLVPSLLRNHCSETEILEFLHNKQQNLARYVLTFESSPVVATIYHRVIAAAIGMWPVAQFRCINLIYENLTALRLDTYHDGLIEMNNSHIELSVVSLCPSAQVSTEVADRLRRFVESVVEHELSKLRDTADELNKPYVTNFRCNHPSHGFPGSTKFIEMSQQDNRKILPCPDSLSHEIVKQKVLSEWFEDSERLQNIPKQKLSEKYLSKCSKAVGSNWEFLGLELGLTDIEIQHITADSPSSVIMRIYKMLRKWNMTQADKATMDVLVQAMQNCPAVSVDWDIIRNVIDEILPS